MNALWRRLQNYTKKTKKIYIVPTKTGLIYIGVNFTLFLMGLVYANNLALLLAFGLFAILLLVMFQTHAIMEKLEIGSITPKSAGPEETPGLLFWPALPPEVNVSFEDKSRSFIFKNSKQREGLCALERPKRGKIQVSYLKFFTKGESGLFYVWTHRPWSASLYVYPAKVPASQNTLASAQMSLSDNGQFQEHKSYQMGEHASRIDWKVFARNEQLLVKNYEDDVSQALMIDINSSPGEIEQRLSKAAFRVSEAHRGSFSWALRAGKKELPLDNGRAHFKKSMEILSEYKQ